MTTRRSARHQGVARAAVAGLLFTLTAAVPTRATGTAAAQATQAPVALASDAARVGASVPWGVGERLAYDVKFGVLRAGSATLEIPEVTDVRGRPAYHAVFHLTGGTFFYHVDDTYESWMDSTSLASLRFHQTQHEGTKTRIKRYEIYPDRETYQDGSKPEEKSVANPLDDGSFLYAVRTLPLRTGDVYEMNRYYKPDRNPVRIRVVRREQVRVPAGTFNAIVVQPTIKTSGLFSEGGRAEVWFSDDAERVVLQMKSSLSIGSITMQLRTRRDAPKAGT